MRIHACLGLSPYDMNTLLYHSLIMIPTAINVFMMWYDYNYKEPYFLLIAVIHSTWNISMYLIRFLSGIIMARVIVQENLE